MKNSLLLILLITGLFIAGCRKDNSTLPPETQIGAGTFGCKINGKVWVPKGSDGYSGQNKRAFYQYIYPSEVGYVFHLGASNYETEPLEGISISTDSIKLQQGDIIELGLKGNGELGVGEFHTIGYGATVEYTTTQLHKGQIRLNRFDETNLIASGTFWFDAIDVTSGEIIHVTEGRFDMKFTR